MFPIEKDKLSYRQGVIGMIQDNESNFLIVQMLDYGDNDWRFPGGGVEEGEELEQALLREFLEELGTDKFEIIGKSKYINQYDWPDNVIEAQFKKRGIMYRGQEQSQFLVKFLGNKNDIKIDPNELKQIKWVKYEDLKNHFTFPNQWEIAEKALQDLL